MQQPKDSRKSLDHKDRPWNWSKEKWEEYQEECFNIMGIRPDQPIKPDPDEEMMVMVDSYCRLGGTQSEVRYIRDMIPIDSQIINCYLPSKNQWKQIYGKKKEA